MATVIEGIEQYYLQRLEEGTLNGLPIADAKYISKVLERFTGQDKIFRLINKMLNTAIT